MTKQWIVRLTVLAILATVGAVAPATAQTYEAEIDCGDKWNPGDTVPFTVRFEEQGFITHDLTVSVNINVPGIGQISLFDGTTTLGPNQDLAFNRDIALPASAPLGDYNMNVTADDGALISFDTCSFDVE